MSDINMNQTAIETLEKIEKKLTEGSSSVDAVRIDDPVAAVESSLSKFVTDSMDEVGKNRELKEQLRDAITIRLSEANISQLMNFYKDVQEGDTSATAALITPIAGLQAAKIQAELENQQYRPINADHQSDERLFKKGTKDVLQGITQLNQLLEKIQSVQQIIDPAIRAEIVEDK